jgi:hypothetical protein
MNSETLKDELNRTLLNEINFVRKDPQTYASKIRKYMRYFKKEILMLPGMPPILTIEGSKAFEEVSEYLDNLDPLPVLKHNVHLNAISDDVLNDILSVNELENLNSVAVERHIEAHGKIIGPFSQALDFGSCNPELVVMNLLVDDGDNLRNNRNTLLNPKYRLLGVSSSSHNQFLYCTVVTFARHFFELGKEIGELSDENYIETLENTRNFDQVNDNLRDLERKVKNMCVDVEDDENDEEFNLPPEVIKIEKNEKIIEEKGIKKKVRKIKKFKEDGVIETEIFKEAIN